MISANSNWNSMIKDAWRTYRNEAELCQVGLAQTDLAKACLLDGDKTIHKHFGVQAILLWSLSQLEKKGSKTRRNQAKVLKLRYVDGETVSYVANDLDRPISTVKTQQRTGIQQTAKILKQERLEKQEVEWYRSKSIELRIKDRTEAERNLLCFLAVFRHVVPLHVTVSAEEIIFQPYARTLQQANLLRQTADGLELHPDVRGIVIGLAPPQTILGNHKIAARFYEREKEIGEAIYHWQQAGNQAKAADLLLSQAAQLGTGEVLALLNNFDRSKLPRDRWAQLQLLHGQVIEQSKRENQSLDEAIELYEDALSANDSLIQAEACYRLAYAYQRRDVQMALTHYTSAEQLLTEPTAQLGQQLLANVHIRRAWIYIDQLPDEALARRELEAAEKYLSLNEDDSWLQLRSDWHSAWGEFFVSHRQAKEAEMARYQAWLLARRAGDVTRTIKAGYNLGCVYLQLARFPEAYRFLLESQALAQEAGNQRMVAVCDKTLGAYHVLNGEQYSAALPLYQQAYTHFKQSGNTFWLASTCYDLAESSIMLGKSKAALTFLEEGSQLVEAKTALGEAFEELRKRFLELSAELTQRQREILHYARTHDGIKKRTCRDLLDISDRQALRELSVLVERGLLRRTGRGRATRYVI